MTPPPDTHLFDRLLSVMEDEVLPRTREGVAAGNKIFGAAILRKVDLSLVVADTNRETENPLWHGEMQALKTFYELPAAGEVRLTVHDVAGRRVAVLAEGARTAGAHVAIWNGLDASGRPVGSGVYFLRLVHGGRISTGKIVLAR